MPFPYYFLFFLLNFICVFSSTTSAGRQTHQENAKYDTCTLPNGSRGTCVQIRECPSVVTLLMNKKRSPIITQFLLSIQCEKGSSPIKVCCGFESLPNKPQVTTTPVTGEEIDSETKPPVETTPSGGDEGNPVIDYSRCGKTEKKAPYIWGGNNALLGDWPWMVALGYIEVNNTKPQFLCGGTLISDEWIITAAHCVIVEKDEAILIIARVGDLDLNDHGEDKATPIDVPILEMYPHPEYTGPPVITNDIALLKLWKRVHFQKLIRPICLLNKDEHMDDEVYSGQNPYVLGWGYRGNKSSTLKSNSLQEATVEILDRVQCKKTILRRYGRILYSTIDHRVLCATSNKADACKGDSGGPMIMPIGSTYYLAGVVSYGGAICGDDGTTPGVYTRVASFTDWIRNVTQLPL